jgi:MFS family permease
MKKTSVSAVFLTVVVDLVGFGIVLPLLPLYADRFHASGEAIGLLFASFSAMQFLFAPIWGRISDRIGRRPVLLVGLAGSVVFYTVFGLADSVPMLFVARIGAGICGATIGVSNAYIADVTPPEQRARGMALIGAAFGIGFTVGPPLGFFAMHEGEVLYRGGFIPASFALGLPGFLAAAVSLVSFVWTLTSVGEPPRRQETVRKLFDLSAIRKARSAGLFEGLLALQFVSVFSFSHLESTLSLMLDDRYGYSKRDMALVYLFIGVTLSVAQGFIVRRLLSRFDEAAMGRAGFVLLCAGFAGLTICTGLGGLLVSLALAVGGFGCVTPSLSSLVSKQADAADQGAILGLAASASALGRILGPFVGNVVYAPEGRQASPLGRMLDPLFGSLAHHQRPYILAAALFGIVSIAAAVFLPRTRRKA